MRRVSISEIVEKPVSGEWGNEADNSSDGIPVIRNTNFSDDGRIDLHDVAYRKIPERKITKKRLKPGDIIIEKSGGSESQPVGRVVYFDINDGKNYLFSNFTSALRPKKEVEPKYVHYALLHSYIRGGSELFQNKTTGIRNLQLDRYLDKIEIPLPSLSEQSAIVAKLDRAQRLIDIDREMLAKYDELIQSVFLEMFGDPKSNSKKIEIGKLGDYAFINMGQSPKGSSYNEAGKGEPLLNGPTEFGEKYPEENQWTTEPKKFAEKDDILFCVRGATAGRTNLADKKYCIGRGLAAIHGEKKLDTTFIHFVLKSHYDYFQNQGQGSTFINIAKKDLSNLEVPIPSQELQTEFITASKQIENQKQMTKESLNKSEELFSSLVQETFN